LGTRNFFPVDGALTRNLTRVFDYPTGVTKAIDEDEMVCVVDEGFYSDGAMFTWYAYRGTSDTIEGTEYRYDESGSLIDTDLLRIEYDLTEVTDRYYLRHFGIDRPSSYRIIPTGDGDYYLIHDFSTFQREE